MRDTLDTDDLTGAFAAALCRRVEAFLAETGMKPSTFGRRSVNDSKIVPRLRQDCGLTLNTARRIEKFMREERARRMSGGGAAEAA